MTPAALGAWDPYTVGLLVGTVIVWIVYDIYALVAQRKTISVTVLKAALTWPVVAFVAGFVCGHFFWSQC